jgi:hypothetical protein
MVGRDLETPGRDEEEDIVMFPHDLDVRLIACADLINSSLMGQVEAMAIKGGGCCIVKDGLVGEGDTEYGSEDQSGLPGAQGKRDIKREYKAEDIRGVVDSGQIHGGRCGSGMGELMGLVMILPVLVREFKLRASLGSKLLLPLIKLFHPSCSMRTKIIAALVEGDLFSVFPGKQGMMTVRAVVPGLLSLLESPAHLKKGATELASELSPFESIVVIEIAMRSIATGTDNLLRHTGRGGAIFHGR